MATAAVAGLILVSCLVCGGLVYFGVNSKVTAQIKEKYGDNPDVKKYLGTINSAWINTAASREYAEKVGNPTYVVYDVHGSEGDGQLIIKAGEKETLVGDQGYLRFEGNDFEVSATKPEPPAGAEPQAD
ncbi:hypothetical protein GC197_18450 [bacterium]|nr:hypothetical protein [bacterium]